MSNMFLTVLEITMDLAFIAFATYGIYVLVKWKRVAKQVNEMCEDLKREYHDR